MLVPGRPGLVDDPDGSLRYEWASVLAFIIGIYLSDVKANAEA
jgi:hypothetical protein